MTEIVALDVGGTHARFALAEVDAGRVVRLDPETTLEGRHYPDLEAAWHAFGVRSGRPLPRAAAIAVAAPIGGDILRFTNSSWQVHPAMLRTRLGVDDLLLVNDFAAVARAVAHVAPEQLVHLCGPAVPLPTHGTISIVGPGTGLGVAALLRTDDGDHVLPTEGGHIAYAPHDGVEDVIVAELRRHYGRVSAERLLSGPGLLAIDEALTGQQRAGGLETVRNLWAAALSGEDPHAVAALDRFCLALGGFAGDVALAHGARAVVIAGGLGLRLASYLPRSGFAERFLDKGRMTGAMSRISVKIIVHPQPGLLGAAAAYAASSASG